MTAAMPAKPHLLLELRAYLVAVAVAAAILTAASYIGEAAFDLNSEVLSIFLVAVFVVALVAAIPFLILRVVLWKTAATGWLPFTLAGAASAAPFPVILLMSDELEAELTLAAILSGAAAGFVHWLQVRHTLGAPA